MSTRGLRRPCRPEHGTVRSTHRTEFPRTPSIARSTSELPQRAGQPLQKRARHAEQSDKEDGKPKNGQRKRSNGNNMKIVSDPLTENSGHRLQKAQKAQRGSQGNCCLSAIVKFISLHGRFEATPQHSNSPSEWIHPAASPQTHATRPLTCARTALANFTCNAKPNMAKYSDGLATVHQATTRLQLLASVEPHKTQGPTTAETQNPIPDRAQIPPKAFHVPPAIAGLNAIFLFILASS